MGVYSLPGRYENKEGIFSAIHFSGEGLDD
jgi:hypothetical protein